ncbi:helix-turn-helix transcriptional regulator [Alkalicoccobacillus porphyridii]|uniref:Helix-turn-helix transcriptional regulator n=1 Tax=Alkalicoccobacillus porphyridii TaxID=2597270 RepID=A0A554A402_9BACI|nr:helix-turn-helix transcriptional regulator [Alkalicoccobacillus porphyridii]TSB48420.1 helix-turn-helix transcriptional regulator [Alkalicoccobacillus porphyridii]
MLRNRVRELRARHDYTQADLAEKIGATRQTVGMIEKADYAPSVVLALRIAAVFRVSLEDVFWLEGEEQPND